MQKITLAKIKRANPMFFDKSHTAHDVSYTVIGRLFTVINRDPWDNLKKTTYKLSDDCKIHASKIVN
jgi:hypothetical protein